jgi:hypothetical protein
MRRRIDSDLAELARLNPTLFLQMRVSRMLGLGFALSLSWIGGVGSLIAFVIGLRARRLIKESGGVVAGIRIAWWCIIAGAVGMLTCPPFIVWLFIQAAKNR